MAKSLKQNQMQFEDILRDVGNWGRYQKLLIGLFIIPAYTAFPMFAIPVIFLTSIPEHWCYVPEVAKSNLSISFQRKLISPKNQSCYRYNVNYAKMARTGKWVVKKNAPEIACDKGWVFDKTNYDQTAVTKFNLVCKNAFFVPVILSNMFQGVIIGTPIFSAISWRFGRKISLLLSAAVVAVSDVGSAVVPNLTLCIVLRIVQGMAISTIFTSGFIIVLELVDPSLRMRVNGLSTTCWFAGSILVPYFAYLTRSWVYLSAIGSSFALIIFIIALWLLPESPSWLITRGKYYEVVHLLHSINKINGGKIHNMSLLLYRVQIIGDIYEREIEPVQKPTLKTLFKYPVMRKRQLLVMVSWMCAAIPYFGLNMNTRNLIDNQFVNFFLANAVEAPVHFACWLLLQNGGRKFTTTAGFTLASIAMVFPYPFSSFQQLNIVVTILGKAGVSAAYTGLYVFGPELFPNSLKNLSIKVNFFAGTFAACFSSFIVFLAQFGKFVPFSVFSGLTAIGCLCAIFLPETNGKILPKTIEEAEDFEKHFHPCSCKSTHVRSKNEPKVEEMSEERQAENDGSSRKA